MSGYRDEPPTATRPGRFWKAVLAGTAIAALVPFAVVVVLLLSTDNVGAADLPFFLTIGAMAIGFPLLVVLLASALIGLPTWFALRQINSESSIAYVGVGTLAGAAIMLLLFGLPVSWLVPLGAVAGAVTSYVWWRYRDRDSTD